MTFGITNLIRIHRLHTGQKDYAKPIILKTYPQWSNWKKNILDYLIWIPFGDTLGLGAAIICWLWIFPMTFPEAHEWHIRWVSIVFLYNLACEFILCSFWHWLTYSRTSPYANGPLHEKKFNPINPYENEKQQHLLREVTFATLGWLQSALIQCVFIWLWASGRLPYYDNFWSHPFFSIFFLIMAIFWRYIHFYWVNLRLTI